MSASTALATGATAPVSGSMYRHFPVPDTNDDATVGGAFGEWIFGRYLYCRALGGWMKWDGICWRRDTTEAVYDFAREYVVDLEEELRRTGASADRIAAVLRCRSRARIDAVVTIARRLVGIAAVSTEFDAHPDLLCCSNGVVNLRTGVVRPNDPALKITKTTGVRYEPNATHPDVETALRVVSPDVAAWLQRFFGYAATGRVNEDLLPVLDGTGSNGKTTLLEACKGALGEYASSAPSRLLMRSAHSEHPTLLADLHGRRLVTVEETAEDGVLNIEQMKALTGGSTIKARFIARDYFEFTPTHQLVVATNHRPAVNSNEHATWRRLRLVPFPHRYAPPGQCRSGDRQVDKGLRERLGDEDQREALLAWIVAGAVKWFADGLGREPISVRTATENWRRAEDVIFRFAEERLQFDPAESVLAAELFDEYKQWCTAEARTFGTVKQFNKRFENHDLFTDHSVSRHKVTRGVQWLGVGVRPNDGTDATTATHGG